MTIDWRALVRGGDQVVCSHMTSEPVMLLRSLADAGLDFPFGVTLGVPFSTAAAALPSQAVLTAFGGMGSAGSMARSRAVRISLTPYSRCGAAYAERIERADVVLVSLARDPEGRLWLGASHGYILEAVRGARTVIAEINAQAPCILGAPWPADIKLHAVMETSYPIADLQERAPDGIERQLARNVAALVGEGACLQVGIGSTPSAMVDALAGHRHLGLHSGMLSDGVLRLIQSGVLDNSRKPAGSRMAVTGCVYGGEALYRFCHLNPDVQLRAPGYTHSAEVIAQHDDFVAINSAIEVDLIGQVNAETIAIQQGVARYVGGVGGLNDFVRAARHSTRGQAIVALPSRTGGAQGRERIVARLSGPATVAATDADVVVTEHGVARLRDATLDVRVRRMLSIADPADREELERRAREMGLLP